MKFKKVFLINCAISKKNRSKLKDSVSLPNLGLFYISSILSMHGYQVKIIDFFVEKMSEQEFVSMLNNEQPEIIALSIYTKTMPFFEIILSIIRDSKYEGPIVVGGPHPTFQAKQILQAYPVDYVIEGEGEFIFLKLLEHLNYPTLYDIEHVDSISYRDIGNSIINNSNKGFIKYLDALPFRSNVNDHKLYHSNFALITSRGCPGNCIYCASRALAGSKFRYRSAENILCEIMFNYKNTGSTRFTLLDDTFTANLSRLRQFISLLNKINNKFEYRIASRGDILSKNILNELFESNCKIIHVGVESGSQEILNNIGKKINLEHTINMLIYGKNLGIHMVASFIIGHYCDTPDTITETLELIKYLKKSGVECSVGVLTPFPGTPIYENLEKFNIKIHTNDWNDYDFGNVIISTKMLSQKKLRNYLYDAVEFCK